jgi:hypothetical protein
MTTATTLPAPALAEPLAALLPTRLRKAWRVAPAPHLLRGGDAAARITDGTRHLFIVERAGTVEVYADHPEERHTPYAVVAASAPDAASLLAAPLLRAALPELDRLTAPNADYVPKLWVQCLTEFGFDLIDHGASVLPRQDFNGVGLMWWTPGNGRHWQLQPCTPQAAGVLSYSGPLHGLYGLLPLVLPPAERDAPTLFASAFTRHMTSRYPQLSPRGNDWVQCGGWRRPSCFIATADTPAPVTTDIAATDVVAEFRVGFDLLRVAVDHLV